MFSRKKRNYYLPRSVRFSFSFFCLMFYLICVYITAGVCRCTIYRMTMSLGDAILVSPPMGVCVFVCVCDRERGRERSFIQLSVKWKFDACPCAPSIFFCGTSTKKAVINRDPPKTTINWLTDWLKCDVYLCFFLNCQLLDILPLLLLMCKNLEPPLILLGK